MAARPMTTSVAHVTADRVEIRGYDLAGEIIGRTTTAEYFYILLTGNRPSSMQTAVLDACIVALAEHGLVPSVQAARMTYAASPESLHGAVAAGLLGAGSVILGSSEDSAVLLAAIVAEAEASARPIPEVVVETLQRMRAERRPVPGFGHPLHRERDPRCEALLSFVTEIGAAGPHVEAFEAIAAALPDAYGRFLAANVSGAIPAALLDVGFPARAMKGVPLVGRVMSLVTHVLEEQDAPIGFGLADVAERAVEYVPRSPA